MGISPIPSQHLEPWRMVGGLLNPAELGGVAGAKWTKLDKVDRVCTTLYISCVTLFSRFFWFFS